MISIYAKRVFRIVFMEFFFFPSKGRQRDR